MDTPHLEMKPFPWRELLREMGVLPKISVYLTKKVNMALMRRGRRGEDPKGEDPKKKNGSPVKSQSVGEVTVTAKSNKPSSPTWDDVDRKMANEASWKKYEEDLKFFREGPAVSGSDGGKSVAGKRQTVTGKEINLTGSSGERYSAEKFNKASMATMKGGGYVSIDDPSLDDTTRSLLKELKSGSSGDAYGKVKSTYVPAGTKLSSRTDLWGGDYNREEFTKASKAGKLDDLYKKKGYDKNKSFASQVGYIDIYNEPEKPSDDLRGVKIDKSKLELPKMELKKASISPRSGKILGYSSEKSKSEDPSWSIKKPSKFGATNISYSAPSLNRRKAVKGEDEVKFGEGVEVRSGGANRGRFGVKRAAYAAVANPLQSARFKSEVKQGKAYFGDYEGASSSDISARKSELISGKKDMRSAIKDVRSGKEVSSSLSKSERIKGYKSELKDIKKDLKTNVQAGKYLSNLRMGSKDSYKPGASTSENFDTGGRTGKIMYATPEKFEGYSDFARSKKKRK